MALRIKSKLLAMVYTTLQDLGPIGRVSSPLCHYGPATWAFSVHQTYRALPHPQDLGPCSSFCLEWSLSVLPGARPFSSIKSQFTCPLPNVLWKVDSPSYSLFHHFISFWVLTLSSIHFVSLLVYVCLPS